MSCIYMYMATFTWRLCRSCEPTDSTRDRNVIVVRSYLASVGRYHDTTVALWYRLFDGTGMCAVDLMFFKFKMADGRHIENRFLAISRRLIGRLT